MNIEKDAMSVTPSVSVVIAVYKVEEYIAQCCHSLFAQTLKNIEYIFVDDCSPDKSMDIVQSVLAEYPDRREQVKIIRHPQNMGVSRTREDGVKAAIGEYIIHCDPDDWVELDMYEQLYNKAVEENADMVLCDIFYHYPDDPNGYYGQETPKELSSQSIILSIFRASKPILSGSLWNKLIRSSYSKQVEWPAISFAEDWIACLQVLKQSPVIGYINRAYYHYRFLRVGSLTRPQYTKESIEKKNRAIPIFHYYLCESGDAQLLRCWKASLPIFMMLALDAPSKIYTDKEYSERYRRYRNCIGKDRFFPFWKKILLYIATFNYSTAFFLYKTGKQIKSRLHKHHI